MPLALSVPSASRRFWALRKWLLPLPLGLSGGLLASACLYEPNQRCDAHQHLGPSNSCLCDDGFVFSGQTCVPCGENETYQAGMCVCSTGFVRAAGDAGTCTMSGLDASCTPGAAQSECADPAYAVCRDRGAGVGYCTKACSADDDCPEGFGCDMSHQPSSCKSAPAGQLAPCSSSSECTGDATYCETSIVHACLVQGCTLENALSCSEGFGCCDLHSLGLPLTLCVQEGTCPTAK